jgi:hypothetical protein
MKNDNRGFSTLKQNILLEQPGDGWNLTTPIHVSRLKATGKYDVKQGSDGKWYYKLKSTTPPPDPTPTSTGTPTPTPTPTANPNPIPNVSDIERIFWEKVTDAALLEKLKDAGKKVWKEGNVWYRDIRDRLSNWWEDMTTLPDWVKDNPCINEIGNINRSDSDDKVVVKTQDGEDNLYFYKDGKFVYENEVKVILNGKWKCVSGKLYIKTEDGYEYTKQFGWDNTGKSNLGSLSSSSTSTSDKKIYTTPGDPYQYRLSNDCEWETKGKSITDWKSLKNLPNAIRDLDKRFPNAKKECGQSTPVIPPPAPSTTESSKPTWTNDYSCFNGFGKNIPTTQTNKISFKSTSGKDSLNFYKNLKFIYEFEDGTILNGTWKCDGNQMVINTEDGGQYTSSKGWSKVTQIKQDDLDPNVGDDIEL